MSQTQNTVAVHSVSALYGIPYCLQNCIDIKDQHVTCNTPEAATIVPSAPEDGRKKRPKH